MAQAQIVSLWNDEAHGKYGSLVPPADWALLLRSFDLSRGGVLANVLRQPPSKWSNQGACDVLYALKQVYAKSKPEKCDRNTATADLKRIHDNLVYALNLRLVENKAFCQTKNNKGEWIPFQRDEPGHQRQIQSVADAAAQCVVEHERRAATAAKLRTQVDPDAFRRIVEREEVVRQAKNSSKQNNADNLMMTNMKAYLKQSDIKTRSASWALLGRHRKSNSRSRSRRSAGKRRVKSTRR